jgi:hypothetical protein
MVIYTHRGKNPQKEKGENTMAIFNTTKDKNLIYIHRIDGTAERNYIYDINTDTFTNAKSGRTVKTIPGLLSAIHLDDGAANCLLDFTLNYPTIFQKTEKIKLYDTIYNINPNAGYCHSIIADTELKRLQAAIKAYSKTENRPGFASFFRTYKEEITRQAYSQILQINDLSYRDIMFLDKISSQLHATNNDKTLRLAYQWWKSEGEWGSRDSYYGFATQVLQFLNKAAVLSYTPQKLHFYRQFTQVSIAYELYKEEHDKTLLTEWYAKFNLRFSNNLFEVVIPQSKQDFVDEAANQNNCVFRTYYPKVIDHETLVVFIRRKEDINNSFITCEIDPNNGQIIQYLKQFNARPTNKNSLDFRILYQTFLYEQFNSSSN